MSVLNHIPISTKQASVAKADCARAAMVVYRYLMGQPYVLLLSTRRNPSRLTLPGGKIDRQEAPLHAAIRETLEEAGVFTDQHAPLGYYPHRKASGRTHLTQTFLARYAGYQIGHEPRTLHWLAAHDLHDADLALRNPIRKQILQAMHHLPCS